MQWGVGDRREAVFGVVALVEDEGDVLDARHRLAAPARDLVDELAEGGRVVLVARVAVVQQGHFAISGDQ